MADSEDDNTIYVSIQNNTGGQAVIVLFYQEIGSQIWYGTCTLANSETSGCILSVPVPVTAEYWAISVLVQDGQNAGYYINQGGDDGYSNWYECGLDGGSYTFTVDSTTLSFKDGDGDSVGMQLAAPRPNPALPAISHVFVVMLENRSFDHMLAASKIPGITAATTANSNSYMFAVPTGPGNPLPATSHVRFRNPTTMPTDPGHEFPDVVTQLCGQFASFGGSSYPSVNNSGFLASYAMSTTEAPYVPPNQDQWPLIMTCFDSTKYLPILSTLAKSYAVCDHWFASMPGPTWPNRFFLHAASAAGFDHSPSNSDMSKWEAGDTLTFVNGTIFGQLSSNKIQYRLYQDYTNDFASYYSAESSAEYASGAVPQAGAIIPPSAEIRFHQLADDGLGGGLANDLLGPYPYPYTFIEPHYGDIFGGTYVGGSSQHPMDEVYGGENLLAGIYAAISASPYWQSSLLVICYDEHGGFYDSVGPGPCADPGDVQTSGPNKSPNNEYGFDFTQYGVRVPAVLVSPLINPGVVSKTVYDHSSVSKMLSQLWGTATMTARDGAAFSPFDDTSLWQSTPQLTPIDLPPLAPATNSVERSSPAERAARLREPLPNSGNEIGALIVLRKMDLEASDGSPAARAEIFARVRRIKTRGDAQDYARHVLEKIRLQRMRNPQVVPPRVPVEPL